ncbi:hypothetical protein LTR28_001254, partial [Elasticomyces elasticus]
MGDDAPPSTTLPASVNSAPPPPPPPPARSDSMPSIEALSLQAPPASSTLRPGQHPAMSQRSVTTANMTTSSTPLGNVNAARGPQRPTPQATISSRGGAINPDIAAKMRAFTLARQGAPRLSTGLSGPQGPMSSSVQSPGNVTPGGSIPAGAPGGLGVGGVPATFTRPQPSHVASAPSIPGRQPGKPLSLAEKRGLKMPGGLPGQAPPVGTVGGQPPAGRQKPKMTLSAMTAGSVQGTNGTGPDASSAGPAAEKKAASAMDKYAEFIDTETGSLKFKGKAVIHGKGIDFSSGSSFSISLDEVDTLDELGKGNYGTVYKVRHSRPQMRRPGQGLAGNKALPS